MDLMSSGNLPAKEREIRAKSYFGKNKRELHEVAGFVWNGNPSSKNLTKAKVVSFGSTTRNRSSPPAFLSVLRCPYEPGYYG